MTPNETPTFEALLTAWEELNDRASRMQALIYQLRPYVYDIGRTAQHALLEVL